MKTLEEMRMELVGKKMSLNDLDAYFEDPSDGIAASEIEDDEIQWVYTMSDLKTKIMVEWQETKITDIGTEVKITGVYEA